MLKCAFTRHEIDIIHSNKIGTPSYSSYEINIQFHYDFVWSLTRNSTSSIYNASQLAPIKKLVFFCKEYLDVGCTMQNAKCHLAFCLLYPNVKLAIWCTVFLKSKSSHKGGVIMVDMLATI